MSRNPHVQITGLKIKLNPFAKGFRDGENRADLFGGFDDMSAIGRLPSVPAAELMLNLQRTAFQHMLQSQVSVYSTLQ